MTRAIGNETGAIIRQAKSSGCEKKPGTSFMNIFPTGMKPDGKGNRRKEQHGRYGILDNRVEGEIPSDPPLKEARLENP